MIMDPITAGLCMALGINPARVGRIIDVSTPYKLTTTDNHLRDELGLPLPGTVSRRRTGEPAMKKYPSPYVGAIVLYTTADGSERPAVISSVDAANGTVALATLPSGYTHTEVPCMNDILVTGMPSWRWPAGYLELWEATFNPGKIIWEGMDLASSSGDGVHLSAPAHAEAAKHFANTIDWPDLFASRLHDAISELSSLVAEIALPVELATSWQAQLQGMERGLLTEAREVSPESTARARGRAYPENLMGESVDPHPTAGRLRAGIGPGAPRT